jgi:hypothetical protein
MLRLKLESHRKSVGINWDACWLGYKWFVEAGAPGGAGNGTLLGAQNFFFLSFMGN